MDIEKEAMELIQRWQPYMKVFGPHKGFPKNKISMVDDIAAFAKAVRVEALEEAAKIADSLKWGEHDTENKQCRRCDEFCCFCENCSCHTTPETIAKQIRATAERGEGHGD